MNTKIGKKVLLSLAAFVLVLPLFLGMMGARAALTDIPPTVDIVIHKKDNTSAPELDEQNTGLDKQETTESTNGSEYGQTPYSQNSGDYTGTYGTLPTLPGINGAGFTIYDVSSLFYGLRDGTKEFASNAIQDVSVPPKAVDARDSADDAYAHVVAYLKDKPASFFTSFTVTKTQQLTGNDGESGESGEDGIAVFEDVPARAAGKEGAVYAIVETKKPVLEGKEVVRSVNTILALPAFETDSTGLRFGPELDTIHIWPKNETEPINMWKTLTGITHTYSGKVPVIPDVKVGEEEYAQGAHTDKAHSDEADKAIYPVSIGDILTYKISFVVPNDIDEADFNAGINVYDKLPVGLTFRAVTGFYDEESSETIDYSTFVYKVGELDVSGATPVTTSFVGSLPAASGNDVKITIPKPLLYTPEVPAVEEPEPISAVPEMSRGGHIVTITLTVYVDGGTDGTMNEAGKSPAVCDEVLRNIAYINTSGDNWLTPDESAGVEMGDMAFQKIDGDSGQILAGAVFHLLRVGGTAPIPLYKVSDAVPAVAASGETEAVEARPMILRVARDGDNTSDMMIDFTVSSSVIVPEALEGFTIPLEGVWIYGLESSVQIEQESPSGASLGLGSLTTYNGSDGFYYLKEVEAPDGYILPTGVAANEEFDIQSIHFDEDGIDHTGTTAAFFAPIKNFHKGTLPSTGGQGIYMLLLIGLIGMVIVAILWKRNKDKEAQGFDVE